MSVGKKGRFDGGQGEEGTDGVRRRLLPSQRQGRHPRDGRGAEGGVRLLRRAGHGQDHAAEPQEPAGRLLQEHAHEGVQVPHEQRVRDVARRSEGPAQGQRDHELRPLAEAFKAYDPKGTGFVDAAVLRQVFEALGFGEITAEDMEILIETGDVDGDGKISLDDFRKMVDFDKGAADGGGAAAAS